MTRPRARGRGAGTPAPGFPRHGLVWRALRPAVRARRVAALSLVASAALMLAGMSLARADRTRAAWVAESSGTLVVVPDPAAPPSTSGTGSTRLAAVLTLAGPDAEPVDRDAVAAMLTRWAGPTAASGIDRSVLPGLVSLGNPGAGIPAAIDRVAPGSTIVSAGSGSGDALQAVGRWLVLAASALVAAVVLGTVLAFLIVSRGVVRDRGREAIGVLHRLGVGDAAIAVRIAAGSAAASVIGVALFLAVTVPAVLALRETSLSLAIAVAAPVPAVAFWASFAAAHAEARRLP